MGVTDRSIIGFGAALTLALLALFAFAGNAGAQQTPPTDPGEPSGDGIEPTIVAGNKTCADLLPGSFEVKDDAPNDGDKTISDNFGYMSVQLDYGTFPVDDPHEGEQYVNFDANKGVDLVIVKGGPAGDSYVYNPEDEADTLLHPPVNPQNGKYYGISHVNVCYDIELEVSKTASTTFTRDHDWKVAKTNDQTGTVTVTPGQSYTVNYEVTVDANGYADSNWAVSGNISVKNPHPTATAAGVSVTDTLTGGITAAVSCPDDVIAPGETMTCTYSASLPDATNRTNTATATTSTTGIGSGTGTAAVTFGNPTTVVDNCVDVTDSRAGALGQVCLTDTLPKKFNYPETFSFTTEQCGENKITNTATVDQDTGTDPTASSDVTFDVRCQTGCTLTQGYWKTHSDRGPAPYDDAWALLGPLAGDTVFFLSGSTYYQVLWTPPAGNPYYVLAHQYIAAQLNILNGASAPADVQAALAAATTFFQTKTPAQAATLRGAAKNAIIGLAATLDRYNNGLIGPGHCSEDKSSA